MAKPGFFIVILSRIMQSFHTAWIVFLVAGFYLLQVDAAETMQPKAPIQNFRIPRFAESGYTQWVLRGERGLYKNAEEVAVEGMELRIYSGDARKLVELSMVSPQAEILIEENRAFSEEPIHITGGNFTLNGVGWNWLGEEKSIRVQSRAQVVFAQGSGASLGPLAMIDGNSAERTKITSDELLLRTLEDGYYFEFMGNVSVVSGEGTLRSRTLIAEVDLASESAGVVQTSLETEGGDSMRYVLARDAVVVRTAERVIRTEQLESFPAENRSELSGLTEVSLPGALITGGRIEMGATQAIVHGQVTGGRAQMLLFRTGGLGLGGDSELSEETIVLADRITMVEDTKEYRFIFQGRVEVLSGALRQVSEKLTVYSRKVAGSATPEGSEEIGQVYQMLAEGAVVIERDGQEAQAESVRYHPLRESAELTGSPEFSDGESTLRGNRIDLAPGRVVVYGSEAEPVVVHLPEIADFGYTGPSPGMGSGDSDSGEVLSVVDAEEVTVESELEPTVVQSHEVIIYHGGDSQRIDFRENVIVTGTNLRVTSDKMEVYLDKEDGLDGGSGSLAGDVKRIIARENVEIVQAGRTATCQTAELLPRGGIVILTGQARVVDAEGTAEGHRITLNRGQRRARVEGSLEVGDGRARVTLPALDTEPKNAGD